MYPSEVPDPWIRGLTGLLDLPPGEDLKIEFSYYPSRPIVHRRTPSTIIARSSQRFPAIVTAPACVISVCALDQR
eukprot:SAG31_NODE_542_length_14269_cov_7.826253_6_plen_75_part_00